MPISVRKQGAVAILDVQGRLVLGEPVEAFRAQWTEALAGGSRDVIVNLEQVPMLDSTGIGSLIRCHSAVTGGGGELKLVGANNVVRQVFKVTRLDRVFEFHDTEESALAAKASAAGA